MDRVTESAHPSVERLRTFGLGQLDEAEASAIEEHVSQCEACCRTLTGVGSDTFIDVLRLSRGPGSITDSPIAPAPAEAAAGLPPELSDHPRYRVLGLLGSGGMGAVYKAEHRLMERVVALKVMNRAVVGSAATVERFRREFRASALLSHPNIVPGYDAEQAGDVHFLVMEYVEGTDLARRVAERGPLPAAEACDYVRQAALGLQHAHEHGMIHRDIKPHNLMRTPDGTIKVLDFGLARLAAEAGTAASGVTGQGTLLGTVDYLAPEQADDARQADIRSDIYSLGCTLYFLLSGRPPFPEGTVVQKIMAHTQRQAQPLQELRPDLPPGLTEVVGRMMAKSPADRYQTPAEVYDALAPFAGQTIILNPAPARKKPKAAGDSRRRRLVAAAAVLLALIGMAAGAAVYRIQTDNGELVISTDDPDVEVVIKQQGKQVRIIDTKTNKEVKLDSGLYELELKGNPEELKLSLDKVTIRRGETVVATVERRSSPDGARVLTGAVKPRPNGVLLFKDDFDQPEPRAVPLFPRELMSFEHVKGEGVLTPREGGVLPAMYPKVKVADFYAEFDVRVPSGDAVHGYGLLFRSTDVTAGRLDGYYTLWLHPAQMIEFDCWQGGNGLSPHVTALNPVIFPPRDTNRIRLEAVGDEFRVFLNGVFVTKFTDNRRPGPGLLGLCMMANGGHKAEGAGYFAKLRVYAPGPAEERVGQVHLFEGHKDIVHGIAVSRDGRYAVSGGGYKFRDGKYVDGAKDYDIRLWDLATRTELRRLSGSGAAVWSVALSPDGRQILSGGGNPTGAIRLLDAATGKELMRSEGREHAVWSVAFSPDGRRALDAADLENEFRLRDVENGKEVKRFTGHTKPVRRAVFSPDGGRALSGSYDGTARLWDVETGKELKKFEGHQGWVNAVAFSPDGRRVLTGGNDRTVRLWDVESGKEVKRFEGHKALVNSVAFSPDGRFALSAGGGLGAADEEDFSLRLWDLESGKELHRFEGHKDVVSQVIWLPDGRHALSCGWDMTVRLWRLPDLPAK